MSFDISEQLNAEEALWGRASIFSAIATQATDGIVLIDTETLCFAEFNDAACDRLGYSRAEFQRLTLVDIQPGSLEFAALQKAVQDAARNGGIDFKHRHRCKDGALRSVLLSNRRVDIQGRKYLAAIWHDITEQERVEQELMNYRRHLESLVDERTAQLAARNAEVEDLYNRAPCGYHSLDRNGMFVAINDTELGMLGYSREEVENRLNIRQLMTQDSQALFERCFLAFAETGKMRDLEFDFVRKDGTVLPVRISADLVCNAAGEFLYSRGVLIDNSVRKRTEAALQGSERKYRFLFETMTQGVFLQRADGSLADVNPAALQLFGLSREAFLGRDSLSPAWDVIREDGTPLAGPDHPSMVTLRSGEPVHDFMVGVFNPYLKRYVWLVVNAYPEFLPGNAHPHQVFVTLHDVTERRQAEMALQGTRDELEQRVVERTAQLRRLAVEATLAEERERRAIARDLHDDLGQLLHVVKIKLEALGKLDSVDPVRLRELNDMVADSSLIVRSLTSQLSPPALETLGLGPALEWLAEEMERIYGLTVTVHNHGMSQQPSKAQAAILFRAVRELLINVVKHAQTEHAWIDLSTLAERLAICVADDGVGTAEWQEDAAEAQGFGLLSIRERIHFLGGTLEIRPRPGKGTRVTLEMPFELPDPSFSEATP